MTYKEYRYYFKNFSPVKGSFDLLKNYYYGEYFFRKADFEFGAEFKYKNNYIMIFYSLKDSAILFQFFNKYGYPLFAYSYVYFLKDISNFEKDMFDRLFMALYMHDIINLLPNDEYEQKRDVFISNLSLVYSSLYFNKYFLS